MSIKNNKKAEDEYDSIKHHKEILDTIHSLYESRNASYGDSFHKLYEDLGVVSGMTQIAHKYNRLLNMTRKISKEGKKAIDLAYIDTLYDLSNYCILLIMELENEIDIDHGKYRDAVLEDK